MSYSKRRFGAELILQIEKNGYSVDALSRWADHIYQTYLGEFDQEVNNALQDISAMAFGQEFIKKEDDLIDLSMRFIRSIQYQKD